MTNKQIIKDYILWAAERCPPNTLQIVPNKPVYIEIINELKHLNIKIKGQENLVSPEITKLCNANKNK